MSKLYITIALSLCALTLAPAARAQDSVSVMSGDIKLGIYANSNNVNSANWIWQLVEQTLFGLGHSIFEEVGLSKEGAAAESQNYSAVPALAQMIDQTVYEKPISSTQYIADVIHHFGVAQPAYAQGVGYAGLQPVLAVWKAFRNLAYFLYVIIFVVVGFMIMFRAKLNPQTVVTLQLALPNLIFTLVLITFSYAIAGFVVDLIYLTIYMVTGLFQFGGLINSGAIAANELLGHNILFMMWRYMLGSGDIAGVSSRSIGLIVQDVFSKNPAGSGYVLGTLGSVVGYLVIAVAILIAMVRTVFTLLKAYISIIVATVFAPIHILMNAIPGSDAFMNWFNGLIAAAAAFPVTAFMIMLGIVLTGSSGNAAGLGSEPIQVTDGVGYGGAGVWRQGDNPGGFVPPLVLPGNVGTVDSLQAFIGLGIILLIPEVLDLVRARLGVKDELGKLVEKNLQGGYQQGPIGWAGKTLGGAVQGGVGYLGQAAFLDFSSNVTHNMRRIGPWLSNKSQEYKNMHGRRSQATPHQAKEQRGEQLSEGGGTIKPPSV